MTINDTFLRKIIRQHRLSTKQIGEKDISKISKKELKNYL